MNHLVIQPTMTAEWQALVQEGEKACSLRLEETLQSYLVFLLMRFMKRTDIANSLIAMEWLTIPQQSPSKEHDTLQTIGDKCLLFSGFYPKRAIKKRVSIDYFTQIGRSAYSELSESHSKGLALLFSSLCNHFVQLADILQAIRELSGFDVTTPLEAMEWWAKTGSQRAYRMVRKLGTGTPVPFGNHFKLH